MHPILASRMCTPSENCCQRKIPKLQGGNYTNVKGDGWGPTYVVPAKVADCRRHKIPHCR
jgi:hypothetical protein